MSGPSFAPAIEALVSALNDSPELASFTVTDRAARPDQLPHILVGPCTHEPWSTNSSTGARLTITLSLSSREGSYRILTGACEAITSRLESGLVVVSGATVVNQRILSAQLEHHPAQDLEIARMQIELLLDFDAAT